MGRRLTRVVYGALAIEIALVIAFAATYNALDFRIYMWGGQAVLHDTRLYLVHAYGHDWFTYPPFAAVSFAPVAQLPVVLARELWDLASVGAFAIACAITARLAGWRLERTRFAAMVAVGLLLEPVYHTLFLGQINLILLAFILIDCERVVRGRPAGIGIGIATAIKMTPGVFAVFFLLIKRPKDALISLVSFLVCTGIAYLVAPGASRLYWRHLFYDTKRVGAPYISNQSPYAAAIRIAGGANFVGRWYVVIPLVIAVIGLAAAAVLARHGDWLGGITLTGITGLLVSPISWTHHWVWIMPALVVLLVRGDRTGRIAAAAGYVLFVVSPLWFTPHSGGPREYGFHWLVTLIANCYLAAGVAFFGYMLWRAWLIRNSDGSIRDNGSPQSNTRSRQILYDAQ